MAYCVRISRYLNLFLSILCAIAPTAHALTTTLFLWQAAEWHEISQLNVSQVEHANVSSRFRRVFERLGDAQHLTEYKNYYIFIAVLLFSIAVRRLAATGRW